MYIEKSQFCAYMVKLIMELTATLIFSELYTSAISLPFFRKILEILQLFPSYISAHYIRFQ